FLRGIANAYLPDLAEERIQEGIVNAVLNVDARGGSAVLPAVNKSANNSAIRRCFQVCIIINDEWSLTTQLQVYMFDRFSACAHDVLAALRTARDRDHIDLVMACKRLC